MMDLYTRIEATANEYFDSTCKHIAYRAVKGETIPACLVADFKRIKQDRRRISDIRIMLQGGAENALLIALKELKNLTYYLD